MDGRENQIILIQKRTPGVSAGRIGRIEHQLGQEVHSRPIADDNLLKLDQICPARNGIVIDAVEMGLVPTPRALQLSGPSGSALAEASDHFQEAVPMVAGASR